MEKRIPCATHRIFSTDTGSDGSTIGITTGDIDNDGDVDVILANGYWYENPLPHALPTNFWTRHTLGAISQAHDILLDDLDGDGDLDAVKRDQGENGDIIWIYRLTADVLTYGETTSIPSWT